MEELLKGKIKVNSIEKQGTLKAGIANKKD
jgi:hypothetical protein